MRNGAYFPQAMSGLSYLRWGRGDIRSYVKSFGLPKMAALTFASGSGIALLLSIAGCPPDMSIFIGLIIGLIPVAWAYNIIVSYDNEVEARAPEFFYDLSEQVKASGSIVKALKRVSGQSYGVISDEVSRILSEVEDEGYDIASSLESMAARVDNRYITRSVFVIKEALTSSSNLESILKMVSEEGRLSISLARERHSGIASSVFVIYLTAIIFLAVISLCITSFIPISSELRTISGMADNGPVHDIAIPYYVLSMSVALCSGLTVGGMRDKSVLGGFKDAAVLILLTFVVYELVVFPGYNLLEAFGL